MWLDVFYDNYSLAAEKCYGCRLEPLTVETELSWMRGATLNIADVIDALAERDDWNYRKWWPQLSADDLGDRIRIPDNLNQDGARKQAVESLHERLKNIECVSVILRFLYPEHFGIISFPVTSLINLPQAKTAIGYYLQYLKNLRELRRDCGSHQLRKISDIDMALWSAAHLSKDADLASELPTVKKATKEMWQDETFQGLRLRNLLQELRMDGERSVYLAFARALLEHDFRVASVIVAMVYESLIHEIGNASGFPPAESRQRTTGDLVTELDDKVVLRQYGIRRGQLKTWWRLRNQAVHEKPEPLSRVDAQTFAMGVGELLVTWTKMDRREAEKHAH